ncbi:amino acid ABC transporter substrate-binding protein [bacterium]|nr:MAG: amino acid ABC transporter substrate-binding protein [bacterium]
MNRSRALTQLTASSLVLSLPSLSLTLPAPALAAGSKAPVNVGLIYSKTGLLASYGAQYAEGFRIGLDYVTHGTGVVDGHKIVVTEHDDAGDPAKAVAAAKDLIGQGYKIIAGTTASGVALQLAPLAKENQVLFISGAAAADGITGNNRYTFRSGRQTYQDVATSAAIVGNMRGKSVLVFAQDSAFGQANAKAVEAVLRPEGASVSGLFVPLSANDFTPFAQKAKDAKADLVFVAWAGTTAAAMWRSLDDQGVFGVSKVVTGLDQRASYPTFAPVAAKLTFLSHYFYQGPKSKTNDYLVAALKKAGKAPDLFDPDGFVAAQMVAHAVAKTGGDDVNAMISALEGWSFEAPKGHQTIRAADHAMLQPMFVARLEDSNGSIEPKLIKVFSPQAVAPPIRPFK